jgi:hypothetical protein
VPDADAFDPTLLEYQFAVLATDGRLLTLPRAGLVVEEPENQLATITRCRLPDVITTEGPMANLVVPGTPYFVTVRDRGPTGAALHQPWSAPGGGTTTTAGEREITRGMILAVARRADSAEIELTGSDNLHTLLEHDVDLHVDAGDRAREVLERLFTEWGAELDQFDGPDVELPENNYRGRAAAVLDELLAQGTAQGAGRFMLRAHGERFSIVAAGGNALTYWLRSGRGAGVSGSKVDISRMVSSVEVLTELKAGGEWKLPGAGDDEEEEPDPPPTRIRMTAEGALDFGGARRIVVQTEKTSDEISQLEAEAALAEYGFPDQSFDHATWDIPYVHKFDRIRISDRLLDGYFFVVGVAHDASAARMHLQLQSPEDWERKAHLLGLQTQLANLKGEQGKPGANDWQLRGGSAGGPVPASNMSAIERLRAIARPVMGRTYSSPGTLGRSELGATPPPGVLGDCSGFVAWVAHQLGCSLPAFTDSIASSTDLIATNSTAGAVAGDLVLQWDGGVYQAGAAYPHVQMYLEGQTVIESGGSSRSSTGRSQIWEGPILTNYPRWEIRRSPCIYNALHGAGRQQ